MTTCARDFRRPCVPIPGILAGLMLVLHPSAFAEDQKPTQSSAWTLELFGGATSASGSQNATIATFAPGTSFSLASGQPGRAVSSWYFGDGASLLNQVLTQFASTSPGTTFPKIVPLDASLKANPTVKPTGGVFGVRLARRLRSRFALEVGLEYDGTRAKMSDAMRDGLKASSDSFTAALRSLLNSAPLTNLNVSSTVTPTDAANSRTRVTGALKFAVFKGTRLEAHILGGAGAVMNSGKTPEATLLGKYSFRLFGTSPMDETDRVVLRITQPKNSLAAVIGGGLSYDLSSRSGLRAEVRMYLSSNDTVTTLTTTPVVLTAPPVAVLSTATAISPGLQFSTQSGVRSTLSAPGTTVTLSTGSGRNRNTSFTIGLFRRF